MRLLPEKEIMMVKKEYKQRRTAVILIFLIFVFLSADVALMPSYVFSRVKLRAVVDKLEQAKLSKSLIDSKALSEKIKDIENKISILESNKKVSAFVLFESVIAQKTDSVRITGISYLNGTGEKITARVKGIALTRSSLLEFAKKLENELTAFEVVLPVSNFAKEKNIDFSLEIISK